MSADFDFTLTTPALLRAADNYKACSTFHIRQNESRYLCSNCEHLEEAHIIVALRTALQAREAKPPTPAPRYDAVFYRGTEWLDKL